jgi:hypothetical protein
MCTVSTAPKIWQSRRHHAEHAVQPCQIIEIDLAKKNRVANRGSDGFAAILLANRMR